MIMAGRGRRLDVGDKATSNETPVPGLAKEMEDLSALKEKINQLNLADTNFQSLTTIRHLFNQLGHSRDTMRDTLHDLHSKALSEAEFGEKLVVILEQLSNSEPHGALLRDELLTLIQNDYEVKDTMCKSDPEKFVNSVMLLGAVYNRIKICGAPIAVLGMALLEYFDLLLSGGEEELKALTKQILLNGKTLSEAPAYDQFKIKLRDILVNSSTNSLSKCWILLIIDLISNDLRPLKGEVKEFYISNLKDEYIKLESFIPVVSNELRHSPCSLKPGDSIFSRNHQLESQTQKTGNIKKGLTKKFPDSSFKLEVANFKGKKDKGQLSPGKTPKRDHLKESFSRETSVSEHDDRFVKEENYYGVQMPRQPKSERKVSNRKSKEKESNELKTSNNEPKDLTNANNEECWD